MQRFSCHSVACNGCANNTDYISTAIFGLLLVGSLEIPERPGALGPTNCLGGCFFGVPCKSGAFTRGLFRGP